VKPLFVNFAVCLHSAQIDSGFFKGFVKTHRCDAADSRIDVGLLAGDPLENNALLKCQVLPHLESAGQLLTLELFNESEVFFCLGLVGLFALLCLGFSVGLHGFK
jgi:hypothetical protein